MAKYLLNIFPLVDGQSYARISVVPLDETALLHSKPFTIDRAALLGLLRRTSFHQAAEAKLTELDGGTAVQVSVSEDDATIIISYGSRRERRNY